MAAFDVVEQPCLGDEIAGLPQGDVAAQKEDPQSERFEHRQRVAGSGQAGQHLGVPDMGNAGGLDRLLVDRRGVQNLDLAAQSCIYRGFHVLPGGFATRRLDLAGFERRGVGVGQIDDFDGCPREACFGGLVDRANRQAELAVSGRLVDDPRIAVDQAARDPIHRFVGESAYHDLRADSGRDLPW